MEGWKWHLYAIWALGQIGDSRAVEPLIAAFGDGDAYVRKLAVDALKAITGEDFGLDRIDWQQWHNEQGGKGTNSRPPSSDDDHIMSIVVMPRKDAA